MQLCPQRVNVPYNSRVKMPNAETKWLKFGNTKTIAFLGKEIIGIASGLHIIFINLNTKDERVEKFDDRERGEGVCCLTGHPVVPMFAVCERRANPKIRVYSYPSINKVSDCVCKDEKNLSGFLSSAFAGTDYLVTLTSLPSYKIIVWLWRSGELLAISETGIPDDSQKLSCSTTSPTLITQLAHSSRQLKVYELNICSKIISLAPSSSITTEKSEKITSSSWMYDGNLLISDDLGNVFLVANEGKRRQLIIQSEITIPPEYRPLVVSFRGGVVVANSSLKLIFYRKSPTERFKSGSTWKIVWEIETSSPALYLSCYPQRDSIIYCSIRGELSEISVGDDDIPRLQIICQLGSIYLFIFSINFGRFVGALDGFGEINVFESCSGKLSGKISIEEYGKVLSIVSHSVLPLLAASTASGKCIIINLVEPSEPFVMDFFYLIRVPLDRVKFSLSGTILGVSNTNSGKIFVLKGFQEMKINISTLLDISEKIVDYLIYESGKNVWILTLIQSNKHIAVGKYIGVYKANNSDFEIESVIKLSHVYSSLHYGNNFGEIIANPFLTKQLHVIKTEENFQKFVLTDAVSLSHCLRNINVNTDTRYIVTFGYDGLVIIRNRAKISERCAIIATHHRQESGIISAVVCLSSSVIVTLGNNGTLIASRISQLESTDADYCERTFMDTVRLLSDVTTSALNGSCDEMWVEMREGERLEREREEVAIERASILSDFRDLKEKLKALIDDNERASNAKLPLENFDLDKKGREEKIYEFRLKQEQMLETIEENLSRENEITEFLRKLCWESMEVPACALISLDGKIRVDNYALLRITEEEEEKRRWDKFYVDLSTKLSSSENFYANLYNSKNNPMNEEEKERLRIRELLNGDDSDEEEKFALTGTTTHRWIREDPSRLVNQILRHGSYTEGVKRNIVGRMREEKLKRNFNELFERMRSRKSREIKSAKERIAKINHCLVELKRMFNVDYTVDHSWLKLEWNEREKPDTVVKVEDEEVYSILSDSKNIERVINLNNSVLHEETRGFGDSFRFKALQRMMNGVLEIKWEDEIKKDVDKPDCLSRDPSTYSDEDLRIIEAYEKAVGSLEEDRKKYKTILETRIKELEESLKSSIDNFNLEMELFYLRRIKVESAVLQETLMRLRESSRHQLRLKGMEEVARLEIEELNPAHDNTKKLIEELTILESAVNETKVRYDNLLKREKLMETKFRGEFTDLKQPMVEHLLRQYKKRPRLGQLTCTSITYLTEMSKCILTGEKSEILPKECLEYLKGMDSLDIMPSGLPSQIDSSHWGTLCKLKRSKVEIEIRLKSCAVELAEADQTLLSHQRTIQASQNRIQQVKEIMAECKRKNEEMMRNMEIQLVLKMGQIETELNGGLRNMGIAVLVQFEEVLRVNEAIVAAGRKKLRAMRRTMEFRRTIEWREWRHGCMRMTLADLKQELKTLQGVKVTKEIQKYLMRHQCTGEVDKDDENCEKILLSTKKRFAKILDTEKSQLFDVTKRINLWRRRNTRLSEKIEKERVECDNISRSVNDEDRKRQERFVRAKLKAIMKRNRLIKRIHDNYGELMSLQTQLELLRLKTYPTLRLKDGKRAKNFF